MTTRLAVAALQQVGLQCACCRQIYHPNRASEDTVESALFGADEYVVCPICEMNVPSGMRDAKYKKRCRRVMKLRFGTADYRLLMELSALANHPPTPERDNLFNLTLRRAQIRFPDKTWPELKQLGDALVKFMAKA